MPASFPPWMRRNFTWHDAQIVARLKPGVTLEQARQSMAALSLQVTAKDFRGPHSVVVTPLREEIAGKTQTALILLLSASVALLLIACVNLTNLLLSRGAARPRSRGPRRASGESRQAGRPVPAEAWCSPRSGRLPDSPSPFPRCGFSNGSCPRPWARRASRSIGACWRFRRPWPSPRR